MRILFYFFVGEQCGMGHWYRSLALADMASERGHNVMIASNQDPHCHTWIRTESNNKDAFDYAVFQSRPHWVVIDIQGDTPPWVFGDKYRVCLIDGVGQPEKDMRANLVVSQGFDPRYTYRAPKHLIVRKVVQKTERNPNPTGGWLVFGGGNDRMGLIPRFEHTCTDYHAIIIGGAGCTSANHARLRECGDNIFGIMANANAACVAMGMTVVELAMLGVPTYVFSCSVRHLESALEWERCGYIKAYHRIGVPRAQAMRGFLGKPFVPFGKPIDGLGAARTIEEMEQGGKHGRL